MYMQLVGRIPEHILTMCPEYEYKLLQGVSFALDTPTRGSQELVHPNHTRHKSPPRR